MALPLLLFVGVHLTAAPAPTSAPATQPASQPTTAAAQAVQHYTDLLRQGRIADAIDTCWAYDRSLHLAFGDRLGDASDEEVNQTARAIRDGMVRSLSQPHMLKAFADSEYSNFSEQPRAQGDGPTVVTFEITLAGRRAQNSLVLEQINGRWRIVDQDKSVDGKPASSLTQELARIHERSRTTKPPLQVIRQSFAAVKSDTTPPTTRP